MTALSLDFLLLGEFPKIGETAAEKFDLGPPHIMTDVLGAFIS
jgi:hypothetical protein